MVHNTLISHSTSLNSHSSTSQATNQSSTTNNANQSPKLKRKQMDFDELMEYSQKSDRISTSFLRKPSNEHNEPINIKRSPTTLPKLLNPSNHQPAKIVSGQEHIFSKNASIGQKESSVRAITSNLFHKKTQKKEGVAYMTNRPRLDANFVVNSPPSGPIQKLLPTRVLSKQIPKRKGKGKNAILPEMVELNPVKRDRGNIEEFQQSQKQKKLESSAKEAYIPAVNRMRPESITSPKLQLNAPDLSVNKSGILSVKVLEKKEEKQSSLVQNDKNLKKQKKVTETYADLENDLDNALNDEVFVRNNTSSLIQSIMGRTGKVYQDESDSSVDMEMDYAQVRREELRRYFKFEFIIITPSGRIARKEDEEHFELC